MKFRHLICLHLLLLTTVASAQDTISKWSRPNSIKINLVAPVSLFYERAVWQRFAFRVSLRALKGIFKEDAANATLEAKFYTIKSARLTQTCHPNGFFLNPYIKMRHLKVSDHVGINPDIYEKETVRSVGFGFAVGYQWVLWRNVVLEVFQGFGAMPVALTRYRRYESDGSVTTRLTNDYYKYDVRSGLSLGFAF